MTGGSPGTAAVEIDHNSVSLDGSATPNLSSVCAIVGDNDLTYRIRNNIFANYTVAQSGNPKHVAFKPNINVVGAVGSVFDNNIFHVPNAGNGFIARIGGTNYATLAAWQAVSSQNANSLTLAPPFVNNITDLHLSSNALNGLGITLPSVTVDIDGDPRGTPPSIGADEFSVPLCNSVVLATD